MDPVSVGLFIVFGVVFVLMVLELRDVRRAVSALHKAIPELTAKSSAPDGRDGRVAALELENRTIKADIAEIKATRRSGVELTRGSMRSFRNQTRGWEIDPK